MPLARFATDTATVWTESKADPKNPFSPTIWVRGTLAVVYAAGGKTQVDQNGAEFQPASTFWAGSELHRGQRIALGDVPDAEPPANAETIRKVNTWTPHPRHAQEWAAFTG